MITLEDINTWIELFDFDIPIELDLSETGNFELYEWDDEDVLTPKFNFDNYFFTLSDTEITINSDGSLSLDSYDRTNPLYLFPTVTQTSEDEAEVFYFNPLSNINRLVFSNDDLVNRKCYINYLGNVQRPINGNTPYRDENGWYVPLDIVFDSDIHCDVADTKVFTPKVSYVYAPPLVRVDDDLFVGNNNKLSDKISCPVPFTLYYNNKEVTDFNVPVDGYKDEYMFRIVTKSEYPYIPYENYVTIPTTFKYLHNLEDLQGYSYLKMDRNLTYDPTVKVELNSETTINGKYENQSRYYTINSPHFVINEKTVFERVQFENGGVFEINADVEFKHCIFNNAWDKHYKFINNGKLSFNLSIFYAAGHFINNGDLAIIGSRFSLYDENVDFPFIHNTGTINITGNGFNFYRDFTANEVIFIRSNELDIPRLLKYNVFDYDCRHVVIDDEEYTVQGNGFCYARIDDDTLNFTNLEVTKNV